MKTFEYYRDLILVLTRKEIKVRYASSILGYLWSIANPLAISFVFYIAFKIVMRVQIEAYTLFLITGLFPWQWLSNSISVSPTIFLGNASIIKKVNFPKNVLPLVTVLQDMVHFILAIPVIIIFMFIYHKTPSWSWLYGIPILLTVQACTAYGIAMVIASVNLFFRDTERLTSIFLMLIFYFTPIIYPASMVPQQYQWLLAANPLSPLMINWRTLFLDGTINLTYLSFSAIYAGVFLATGLWVYRKLHWRFAEVL